MRYARLGSLAVTVVFALGLLTASPGWAQVKPPADMSFEPASIGSTPSSEALCRRRSLPPRTSCMDCTMNSISRIPPGPSLMLSCNSLRATSARIWACNSRSDATAGAPRLQN